MAITVQLRGAVAVIRPEGNFTAGADDAEFREALAKALPQRAADVLVDLGGVTLIDSAGIGRLMAAYTIVTQRGGRVRLVHLPPRVHDILQITQLLTVFDVFDDEEQALASFG